MKERFQVKNTLSSYEYPARMLRSVVLPAPEGPMMAVSPGLKHPDTPFKICFVSEIKKSNLRK